MTRDDNKITNKKKHKISKKDLLILTVRMGKTILEVKVSSKTLVVDLIKDIVDSLQIAKELIDDRYGWRLARDEVDVSSYNDLFNDSFTLEECNIKNADKLRLGRVRLFCSE